MLPVRDRPPVWVRLSVTSVSLSVCLSIRAVTGKRLDLSTPKSMAGRGHGLTLELKLKGCKVQVEECECHTP